ncbi:hypothetical protein GW17_00008005 [Ensete ventricosum]|nr:hypothetical protein GW17_00008005 [Ensete ventricosum]
MVHLLPLLSDSLCRRPSLPTNRIRRPQDAYIPIVACRLSRWDPLKHGPSSLESLSRGSTWERVDCSCNVSE